jgi:hypothetical protein
MMSASPSHSRSPSAAFFDCVLMKTFGAKLVRFGFLVGGI